MQSRKKQNLEVERKIKKQKRMYLGVFCGIVAVVVLVIGWLVWDAQSQRWIMTFNGERISTGDFRFMSHLTGQPINEFTRYDLLNELMVFLTVLQRGEAHGVGLTSDEIAANEVEARELRVLMEGGHVGALGFISDRRIGELMGAFDQVGLRLMDIFIEYVPDEEEFRELFDELVAHEMEQGTEIMVKFMATETRDGFDEMHALYILHQEEFDFDDLARRFCVLQTGLEPMSLDDFVFQYGIWTHEWDLRLTRVGDISPLMTGENYFFIVYVEEHREPELDLEELEADSREFFILQRRQGLFQELVNEWVLEADYEINYRVFNNIN